MKKVLLHLAVQIFAGVTIGAGLCLNGITIDTLGFWVIIVAVNVAVSNQVPFTEALNEVSAKKN